MPYADRHLIDNQERLQALYKLCILDTPPQYGFDNITELTCQILDVPISLVTLVDRNRQWFKSAQGLSLPYAETRETPLSHSFCQHVVAQKRPIMIENAPEHPLVFDNLAIQDLGVIAYLGVPLITKDGYSIGSLCIIDSQPRKWTEYDISVLVKLAISVMTEVELRVELLAHENLANEIAKREHFINKVLNTMPISVVIYDVNYGDVTFSNYRIQTILGYSKDHELNFADFVQLIHPDDKPLFDHFTQQLVNTANNEVKTIEYRVQVQDGTWHWLENDMTIFQFKEGDKSLQILSVIQDVTLSREADRAIFEGALETEQSRLLREFIQNISHDLRTPLSNIQVNLDLIDRLQDQAKIEKRIQGLHGYVLQMRDILDQLGQLAEIERSAQVILKDVYVDTLLYRTVEWIKMMYSGKPIASIDTTVEANLPRVQGDTQKLQIALAGIIENAIQHTPVDGHIHIEAKQDQQELIIRITDTGRGIEANHLPYIFEPFYKSNVARSPDNAGSGLGLTMVKKIIQAHQGQVNVESEGGHGTIVTIRIPLKSQRNEPTTTN